MQKLASITQHNSWSGVSGVHFIFFPEKFLLWLVGRQILGFEVRASSHADSTSGTTPPTPPFYLFTYFCFFSYFSDRVLHFHLGLTSDFNPPIYASHAACITEMYHYI
jgi:hypothetical protein